ncbi:hypothetical protein [Candidatus Methylobacter favarea]|uniref:hypothetical protein n=1 Tax=Candidatus Methylobacter favarea TaxID=2707345 RepID=UPI001FE6141B|nr:hypothetical protein [Candidatus Methylobacter favarea]
MSHFNHLPKNRLQGMAFPHQDTLYSGGVQHPVHIFPTLEAGGDFIYCHAALFAYQYIRGACFHQPPGRIAGNSRTTTGQHLNLAIAAELAQLLTDFRSHFAAKNHSWTTGMTTIKVLYVDTLLGQKTSDFMSLLFMISTNPVNPSFNCHFKPLQLTCLEQDSK